MASLMKRLQKRHAEKGRPSMDDLDSSSSSDEEVAVQAKVANSKEEESVDEQVAATTEDVGDSEDELRVFKDPDPASKEWKNR